MESESKKLSLIQWLIELHDEETLNEIEALRSKKNSLTEAQHAVLEKRLERYRQGLVHFSPWDEVKDRIRKNVR